jgi:hypothetical protein
MGVSGKVKGVGGDILAFLDAVADHYGLAIKATSGKRTPDEQAEAMWNNWIKLKRGRVYSNRALPNTDRKTLDDSYAKVFEDDQASDADKKQAEAEFMRLAAARLGKKSRHATGRAIDVVRRTVPDNAYKAITLLMSEVPEGGRKDIYHFESVSKLPPVTDAMKAQWPS